MREKIGDQTLHQIFDKLPENQMNIPWDEQETPNLIFEEW